MIYLPLYALIAPLLGFSREYTNIVPRLWSSLVFWLTIMGLPILLLTRDFAWKAYVPSRPWSPLTQCAGTSSSSRPSRTTSCRRFRSSICRTTGRARPSSRR